MNTFKPKTVKKSFNQVKHSRLNRLMKFLKTYFASMLFICNAVLLTCALATILTLLAQLQQQHAFADLALEYADTSIQLSKEVIKNNNAITIEDANCMNQLKSTGFLQLKLINALK